MSINTASYHYIYEPSAWPAQYPPRPYLCAAVVHALGAVDAGRRGIVHLPTGSGKTVQVGKVTEHSYHRGQRTLFLHHRRELRTQALKKFRFIRRKRAPPVER
jgi:superfamily II DNA or RNA helicase